MDTHEKLEYCHDHSELILDSKLKQLAFNELYNIFPLHQYLHGR